MLSLFTRAAIMATACAMIVAALSSPAVAANSEMDCLNSTERELLTLMNDYRQSRGRRPLAPSLALTRSAFLHSKDMGIRDYLSHSGANATSPWDRMTAQGYRYNTWKGENIAGGFADAQSVFNAWRSSAGHDANILSGNYQAVGIGMAVVTGSQYRFYWTTDFGGVADTAPSC